MSDWPKTPGLDDALTKICGATCTVSCTVGDVLVAKLMGGVVGRLLALQTPPDWVRQRFCYLRPGAALGGESEHFGAQGSEYPSAGRHRCECRP